MAVSSFSHWLLASANKEMARLDANIVACARLAALLTCAGASFPSSSSTGAPVPPSSAGTGVASSAAPVYCPGLPSGGYDETCSRCVLDAACVLTCDDCGGLQAGDPVSASCDLRSFETVEGADWEAMSRANPVAIASAA